VPSLVCAFLTLESSLNSFRDSLLARYSAEVACWLDSSLFLSASLASLGRALGALMVPWVVLVSALVVSAAAEAVL